MSFIRIKQIFFIVVFFVSLFFNINVSLAQETGNCSIKYSPVPLIKDEAPLNLKDPDTGKDLTDDERRIKFEIKVSDTSSTYQVVFYRPNITNPRTGQIYQDNLKPDSDGILRNADGSLASLLFASTPTNIFDVGDHVFDVVRKGNPGVYCRGNYIINDNKSGGIQSCDLTFTPAKPSEQDSIQISGNVKFNQSFRRGGDWTTFRIQVFSKDSSPTYSIPGINSSSGDITPVNIGKLNPGTYTIVLQKEFWTTLNYEVTKNLNPAVATPINKIPVLGGLSTWVPWRVVRD